MKILVPLNNKNCISTFVDAGADEFYIGFYDEQWTNRYGNYVDLNRMSGFGKEANRYSFYDLPDIVTTAKDYGKKLYITMNANVYSQNAIKYIEDHYFPAMEKMNIDGLIVSDKVLASSALSHHIPVTISTMGSVYNRDIAKVYKSLGAQRIILPRDLSLNEIRSIVDSCPQVEYEVFHMRNRCIFSDSHCLGFHRPECGATCSYLRFREEEIITNLHSFSDSHDIELNDYLFNNALNTDACAMCAIYKFFQMGISSLKIVGRSDDVESLTRDISLTAKNIRIARESQNEEDYFSNMVFHDNVPQKCMLAFSCYYPEVRFGR